MTIPLATTTVTIERQAEFEDAWPDTEPTWNTVATGIAAHLSGTRLTGTEGGDGNQRVEVHATLLTDPCDLQHLDRVTDAGGQVWEVIWVVNRTGLAGLDLVHAEVKRVEAEVGAGT